MTRLEASSSQALSTTPMALAALPGRASANSCTPVPLSQTLATPEQGWALLPEWSQRAPSCSSCSSPGQGLGSVWHSDGWSRQTGSIQTPGQWQQLPNQRPQKLEEQIQQVGRASTAWRSIQLSYPAGHWGIKGLDFPGAEEPWDSLWFSPCHFTLYKFHSNSHCLFQPGGSSHLHSMLHHPSCYNPWA